MTKFEERANIITFCILIVLLIIMFICVMCLDPADKREYYSHKTVIINNIEYKLNIVLIKNYLKQYLKINRLF